MSDDLPFTGERFIPGTKGEIWVEHWHRYHFARRWVEAKQVLDVACGEGYGTALLARSAARVQGVDISRQAIEHARRAYAGLANVEFHCAPCTQLPLADASVDIAVSFETLEHIAGQAQFMDELARVLKPDGVLVLSCPNKLEYSDKRNFANEFHVKELYREELGQLVAARFPHVDWYGQRPTFFSLIAPDSLSPGPLGSGTWGGGGPGRGSIEGQLVEVSESAPAEASDQLSSPLYFMLVASRSREAIAAVPAALSVFSDRDDWVHRDYEKVMGYLERSARHGEELQKLIEERDRAIAERDERLRAQEDALMLQEAAISVQKALAEAQGAAHEHELAVRKAEIDRRGGLRWWLKLPLVRLGLLK